jgi:hypothetical protein
MYIPTSTAKQKIKEAWNENPLGVAIIVTGLLGATAKLIDAVGSIQSKRAYSRHSKLRAKR